LRVQTATATKIIASASKENVNTKFTINLFPNPAGDQLNLWVEGVNKKTEIKVYNLMGKLVMQQEGGNTLTQLNISKLSAGFYLVHVNDGIETRSAKFVKR
jgi:bacillolysin